MTTPTIDVLKTELETFENNRENLLATDDGKYVLIHGDEVVGTYYCEKDAVAEGYKKFGTVSFLVKLVIQVEIPANFVNDHLGL